MSVQIATQSRPHAAVTVADLLGQKPSTSRVLLVEDDRNIGLVLTIRLEDEGWEVVWRTSVKAARDYLLENRISVAVVDRRLPDGDGRELIPIVANTSAASVILMSGSSESRERQAALDAGAAAYLSKPFDTDELTASIRHCSASVSAGEMWQGRVACTRVAVTSATTRAAT
jgi:DNA-binding response OmpR family regulator